MKKLIASLTSLALASLAQAGPTVTEHYEAIRQALLHDSTDAVATHASELATAADPGCGKEWPAVATAAKRLAAATDLAASRKEFAVLSEALVACRKRAAMPGTLVVYCPMARASWIQPAGEIGNPYYGPSMARCGEIVSEDQPPSTR